MWVTATPDQMAADALAGFADRFEWMLDDLRGLVPGQPIIAQGFGLCPELAARVARDRVLADGAARSAGDLGIRVIDVDGTRDADVIPDVVADHFRPCLPA